MISQTIDTYDENNENNENNLNINSININNSGFNNNDKISNKNSNNNIQIISNKNSSNNLNKNSSNNLSKNNSNNLKKISIKNSNKNSVKNSIKNSNNNSNFISNQNSKKNSIRNFDINNYNQNDRMPFNLNNNKSVKANNINSNNFNSNSNNFLDDENDNNNNNKTNKEYTNNIIENYTNEKEYKNSKQFSENIDDDDNNNEENNNDNLNIINTSNKLISGNDNNKNNIINSNIDNENSEGYYSLDNDNDNDNEDSKHKHNFSDNNSENNNNNNNNEITNKYKIQYIIESRKGFENLIDKNYLSAKSNYLKCFEYSNTYFSNDKQKIIDSLINLSITEFYDAEFNKSLEYINQAHNVYINTNFYDDNINTNTLNELGIKLYTNFILSNLSLNNYDDCLKNANEIVKIIQNEIKNNNKEKAKNYFQECVYTLFRVNTLKNSDSVLMDEFNLEENINNNNNNKKKIINHIMKGFQEFLKSKNYEFLYNHFKEANDKYKEIEDKNGYYFTFFYQYVSLFELGKLNEKEIEQIKKKISICNKKVIGNEYENLKEKSIDVVIKEFKEKSECAVNIFNILLNIENEIENNINNDNSNVENESEILSQSKILDKSHLFTNEKISTPIFIKLLLHYSLNYLIKLNKKKNNEFISTLIKEIELLIDKTKKDLINIDIINLKFLDIEITQSLKTLFDNLILIYYKSKLKKALIKYKLQIIKQIKSENEIEIQNFLEKNLNKVENGFMLKKINFSSSGTKEHYYLIDSKNNNFCIGKNEKDKNKENKNLINEIIKIVYGFSSRNIKKKIIKEKDDIKNLLKKPWKFLSIVLKDRSIDLYMENNVIKDNKNNLINYYFYGFYNYYQKKQKLFKINSCSYFFCLRTKFKLIWKLKEMYKNGKLKEKNEKSLKLFQDIFNEKGIQKFSFVKLFLLFFQNFDEEENEKKEEEKIVL